MTLHFKLTPRPKRITVLVDQNTLTDEELYDIIHSYSYCWGGRYYSIIPIDGQSISSDWMQLLKNTDPDTIYSMVPIESNLSYNIYRNCIPIDIRIQNQILPLKSWIHGLDQQSIGITGIPDLIMSQKSLGSYKFISYDVPDNIQLDDLLFLKLNFGILKRNEVPISLAYKNVPSTMLYELTDLRPTQLLENLLSIVESQVLPIDLIQSFVPTSVPSSSYSFGDGFHLVVGNSLMDKLYCWNRALMPRINQGRDVFWLPCKLVENQNFLEVLGKWISRCFFDRLKNGVKIISYSIHGAELEEISNRISHSINIHTTVTELSIDSFPIESSVGYSNNQLLKSEICSAQSNETLLNAPEPPLQLLPSFQNNYWMVDLEIRKPEIFWESWKFPCRQRVSDHFIKNSPGSRINGRGEISFIASTNASTAIFHQPDFDQLSNIVLMSSPIKQSRFVELKTEDKGDMLYRVVQLFGGLDPATRILTDPFYLSMLNKLAVKFGDFSSELREQLAGLLQQTKNNNPDKQNRIIANGIENLIRAHYDKSKHLSFKEIENIFQLVHQNNPLFTYSKYNDLFPGLINQFNELVKLGVITQGIDCRCPNCKHREWIEVNNLKSNLKCPGCSETYYFPVNPTWTYRLNNLVFNALHKHGFLPVIQTLKILWGQSRGMFLWLPTRDLFEANVQERFTDLDIIAVSDGKLILGEVKSSSRDLSNSLERLIVVAEQLIPENIVVAMPEDKWDNDTNKALKSFTDSIKNLGIIVSPVKLPVVRQL